MIKIEHSSDGDQLEKLLGRNPRNVFTGKLPSQYGFDDFLDKATLDKVHAFEKNNPEKIKLWQEEDKKTYDDYYKSRRFLIGFVKGRKSSENQEKQSKIDILNRCKLLYPTNKFVISVSQWYERTRRISEKQLDVLASILRNHDIQNDDLNGD